MKKRKVKDTTPTIRATPESGANAIANLIGGLFGTARDALRGKKNPEPEQVPPEALEKEREQNYNKVMKKYSKRSRK